MSTRTSGESSTSGWDVRRRSRTSGKNSAPDSGKGGHEIDATAGDRSLKGADLEARVTSLLEEVDRLQRKMEPLARFRAMIDGADEAIFLVDSETSRFVDANNTALRWFDIARDKLVSLSIRDVDAEFPLEHPQRDEPIVNDTRDYQRPLICGRVHRRKDGTAFPVEVAVALRRFGKRTYTLVVARESRRRRESERALRELDDKYQALLRLTKDAAFVCASDGKITDANQALTSLLGYRPAEVIGLEATDLFEEVPRSKFAHPELADTNQIRDISVLLRSKGGSIINGEMSWTALGAGDTGSAGSLCVMRRSALNTSVASLSNPRVEAPRTSRPVMWYSLLVAGVAVAAFGWTNLITFTYPYGSGFDVWAWGMRTLAPVLALLAIVGPRSRLLARIAAASLGIVALVILAVYVRYVSVHYVQALPYELRNVTPGTAEEIRATMLAASGFTIAWLLFFGWLAWRLWKGTTVSYPLDVPE